MKLNVDLSRLEVARESIGAPKASISQITARRSLGQKMAKKTVARKGELK